MAEHRIFRKETVEVILATRFDANAPEAEWPHGVRRVPGPPLGAHLFVHVWADKVQQIQHDQWIVQHGGQKGTPVWHSIHNDTFFKGFTSRNDSEAA